MTTREGAEQASTRRQKFFQIFAEKDRSSVKGVLSAPDHEKPTREPINQRVKLAVNRAYPSSHARTAAKVLPSAHALLRS